MITVLAYSRGFWPLFLHVLGAMTLFGVVLAAFVLAIAGLPRATFTSLLVALPAWAVTLACAFWIESDEGLDNSNATWIGIGHAVLEPGLIVLLGALGTAWWWRRSGKTVAARISMGLSGVYLLLLCLAWLAMSGKWGS
ncbi:MAG TPA: hypothetical protein VHC67_02125 [Gaiellaceae bacterium]|nr:hypothetical protein [Gaiellaceae bacterium]HVU76351.1 hypothetical protein [Gaiellaceae bacterium]